jgi:hypothetical protein
MITLSFSKSILEKLQEKLIALRLSNICLYRTRKLYSGNAEDLGISA